MPLGTFAVIEGTCHSPLTVDGVSRNFRVEIVNGKHFDSPVEIAAVAAASNVGNMTAQKRYVLHGYENAFWTGAPPQPPGESEAIESDGAKQGHLFFSLRFHFRITSIEKEDGVAVSGARPIDPGFPLDQPKPGQPIPQPPLGVLGQPLGTYLIIIVGAPRGTTKGIECEVLAVNGKPVAHRTTISVPFFEVPQAHEQAILRGFENGDWRGVTSLPVSETKEAASSIFGSGFTGEEALEFCNYFAVTNWTQRLPAKTSKQ